MASDAPAHPLAGVAPEPGVAKPDPILVADGIVRSFGGLVAVDVDHLEIQRGVITAIIGPNGAGKTTFFNVMTGFDRPQRGRWSFDGVDISRTASHRVARQGMVRTFQLTKALARMRVMENMMLGATEQRGENFLQALLGRWTGQERDIQDRADELLERFKLAHMRDEYAGELSGGQRKLLEMARALMVEPAMIMLDEPMAGVNPALTQSLLSHITDLRDQHGMSVVFVEHDMDVVMGISDWVVCLAEGRVIAEGPPEHVGKDPAVIDAYLGMQHDEEATPAGGTAGPATSTDPADTEPGAAAERRTTDPEGDD